MADVEQGPNTDGEQEGGQVEKRESEQQIVEARGSGSFKVNKDEVDHEVARNVLSQLLNLITYDTDSINGWDGGDEIQFINFTVTKEEEEHQGYLPCESVESDQTCKHYKSKLKVKREENFDYATKPDIDDIDPREILTVEEYVEFKEAFRFLDSDGDGKIVTTEVKELMQTLGQNPTDCYLRDVINYIDYKNTGYVDFYQFCVMLLHQRAPHDPHSILRAAFQSIEPNPLGMISVAWLRKILTNLGDKYTHEEVDCIYRVMGADKTGKFNYEEFIELIIDS